MTIRIIPGPNGIDAEAIERAIDQAVAGPAGAASVAAEVAAGAVNDAGSRVSRSGDAMTGPLTLAGDATADLHAVPRRQVPDIVESVLADAPVETRAYTAAGDGASATRSLRDKVRSLAVAVEDYATAAAARLAALGQTVVDRAYRRVMAGPDGGPQFEVAYTPQSTTNFVVSGGIASVGPVLYTRSDTVANVSGTIALQGRGSLYVGNDVGILGAVIDPGGGVAAGGYAALVPGTFGAVGGVRAQGAANVGLALSTLGTGALTRDMPDGATAGGTARGNYAVDWQGARSFATNVAQASYSTISGGRDNMTSNARGRSDMTIAGGRYNALTGDYSWCPGGFLATDRQRDGTHAFASGQFAAQGDAQASGCVMRAVATSASAVRLTTTGLAADAYNAFSLPANAHFAVTMTLAALDTGAAGDAKWQRVVFGIKRGATAASTTLVGAVNQVAAGGSAGAASWSWSIAADATNGGININFVGEAGKTIRTVARLDAVEVTV